MSCRWLKCISGFILRFVLSDCPNIPVDLTGAPCGARVYPFDRMTKMHTTIADAGCTVERNMLIKVLSGYKPSNLHLPTAATRVCDDHRSWRPNLLPRRKSGYFSVEKMKSHIECAIQLQQQLAKV